MSSDCVSYKKMFYDISDQTLQPYIAEGFLEDCEELIYKLTQKFSKVDWHKFCYCWKQMEFDMLF